MLVEYGPGAAPSIRRPVAARPARRPLPRQRARRPDAATPAALVAAPGRDPDIVLEGVPIRRDLFHLLAVSAVVMGLAQTIAREKLFAPVRERLGGKETWLGYLVSCPYCASHWLAFVLVPLTGAYFVDVAIDVPILAPALRWFLSSILVVVLAAFLRVGFWFVDESQGLVRRRQRTEEERAGVERATRERLEDGDEAHLQ